MQMPEHTSDIAADHLRPMMFNPKTLDMSLGNSIKADIVNVA